MDFAVPYGKLPNGYSAVWSVPLTPGHSSCRGTLQQGRYQGPRWPHAARWAQCTYIDIHFFSGRQDKFIHLDQNTPPDGKV